MPVVTTLDVHGLTANEFRVLLDEMGVEKRPEPGSYVHFTSQMDFGYRIMEHFMEHRLVPATKKLNIDRKTDISFNTLHNFFGPRMNELPGLIATLPGGPDAKVGSLEPRATTAPRPQAGQA